MEIIRHSVTIDTPKCRGCTTCLHNCPTKSIRVRNGKAIILAEKCIDCGECIRVCPNGAKIAVMDSLSAINNYDCKIALMPPSFIGQFDAKYTPSQILSAVHKIGFDYVYEVSYGAEIIGKAISIEIKRNPESQYISSACPTITKLILESFPTLSPLIAPFKAPLHLTAERTRKHMHKRGYTDDQIGLFFITPCTAKATEIYNEITERVINGAIPIREVYHEIIKSHALDGDVTDESLSSSDGQNWAVSGGEAAFLERSQALHVNGISNVIKILEAIERGELKETRFFELDACVEGCVGGCLAVANPFVAKNRIALQIERMKLENPKGVAESEDVRRQLDAGMLTKEAQAIDLNSHENHSDIGAAIARLAKIEEIYARLPKFDCGSCGSPGCRAMAEDIADGTATEMDCVFMLKDAIARLSKNMLDISSKVMPIMSIDEAEEEAK